MAECREKGRTKQFKTKRENFDRTLGFLKQNITIIKPF